MSAHGLEAQGFRNLKAVNWNLNVAELYEEAIRRGEGHVAKKGPLVVLTGLLIPSEVTIVPLFQMFHAWGMIDTHWPLILVPIFGAPSVLATFIMRQFFIALPVELEEAARVDGLGRFATFWRIAVPLARPALGAVAIFTSPPSRSSPCRRL